MYVILDAHASRWNTSGSVPPMFLPGLLIGHVVPAQSVAHVKVYVPTVKLPTARRCTGLARSVEQHGSATPAAVGNYSPYRLPRCGMS
jgi:hypothetical protein